MAKLSPTACSFIFTLALAALPCAVTGPAWSAAGSSSKLPSESGKRKLMLFAKNPATWAILKNGGSGKLVYHKASGKFSMNAVGLYPRTSYALVRYADAPPKGDILARGISDHHGTLELSGVWKNWTKKFWVVAGEDVTGSVGESGTLKAWRPDRYLFEEKPLGIVCSCPEPEEP